MKKPEDQNDSENSGTDVNSKSEEFEKFENAVRHILKLTPEEAEKIRKLPVPKDPDERGRS
ncbi:MAG: hypothetical protein Q8913_03470 [Bacteroidota bacterium]|nr:hypothetical protein [Bacteroidota bacterium]